MPSIEKDSSRGSQWTFTLVNAELRVLAVEIAVGEMSVA
jgi:hypothetical protein